MVNSKGWWGMSMKELNMRIKGEHKVGNMYSVRSVA